ncbi:rhodanese-like domain-containing protein [Micromonospora sp. WMMA1998]|uniref:rhodanese-like domain-containing protein n=1 Tax=Micromonospora sp. WMMA1998 TaxID=3015167 RepID=UPI00248C5478|nr:rhodanese-like domain-containing protein [Micromonospora sp. WMMA1998]WBC16443.1 rhodanese-like domain-containing protein [Micromonospora sp. WMMA1998]
MSQSPVPPDTEIGPVEAARLADDGRVELLDVREPDEWRAGHAPQARHLPLGTLRPDAIRSDRPVVAVCRSGKRSAVATARLRAVGVPAYNLTGGMRAWAAAGLPLVTDAGAPGALA